MKIVKFLKSLDSSKLIHDCRQRRSGKDDMLMLTCRSAFEGS